MDFYIFIVTALKQKNESHKNPLSNINNKSPKVFFAEHSSITILSFDWVIEYYWDKRRRMLTITVHEVEVKGC